MKSQKWGYHEGFDRASQYFNAILALLTSDESRRNREYIEKVRAVGPTAIHRDSHIDVLKQIWGDILPHRELLLSDEKVAARITGSRDKDYHGKHMSDGERVALYLLGQAICAPKNSVIIVDEPELHLHRSVQAPLWDAIERHRRDCLFVYLTHDVDFAASRSSARKIWLKSFDGTDWEWDFVPYDALLPEPLLLQILGNRRPVLFIEGTPNSHDIALYRSLFTDRLVVPLASCAKVIEAVRAMKQLSWVSHLTFTGIIDLDRRNAAEVSALRKDAVFVAQVAEVENLFCLEAVVRAIASHLRKDSEEVFAKCRILVSEQFAEHLDRQVRTALVAGLYSHLKHFDPKQTKDQSDNLGALIEGHVKQFEIEAKHAELRRRFEDAVTDSNYSEMLRMFNHKGLLGRIATGCGINQQTYVNLVTQLIRDYPTGPIASAIRDAVGLPE